MRRLSLSLLALPACLALSGCYYDPDYGYVRNSSGGDAYYGTETTTTVVSGGVGYVDPQPYGYGYGGYYGYGPGCCYGGTTVIYRDGYGRRYYGDRYGHGRPPPPGGWQGRPPPRPGGGDWHGRPPPPGGWGSRGDDHRPPQGRPDRPPGGWQGGNRPSPPQGGWHGNRSQPPSNGSGPRSPQGPRGRDPDRGAPRNHND
ncbi:MAG TPA: hypothetical protein VGN46_09485 [Luteibacter sp.]|uniref:hypothetical protein n=1 Tax=Luteibacter sp. TaxID=1886636 RepID=UPI002F3F46FC